MILEFDKNIIHPVLERAFYEDLGEIGDITSLSTISDSISGKAKIQLKHDGVIAGLPILNCIFDFIDPSVHVLHYVKDGRFLNQGTILAEFEGRLQSILIAERIALNFLQHLSGIATLTRQFVNCVSHTRAKILDTRKTTPGLRLLEKYAVRLGGGINHRSGLYDMVLIKDNHIDSNNGVGSTISRCMEYLKLKNLSVPIEVETRSLKEVEEALRFPIQRIMLDNMSIQEMSKAVLLVNDQVETEASGNILLENVVEVAETGVNFISIGALTHSVKTLDMSLKIKRINQ